ncbi:hypothetical protein SODALDRAFT_29367 [Sodiomyces alkalinus F11]|uniref:Uncharacterized protein n=1 Tax=Sodiomyces alkalinus (strain CBS 110278 / VKM F-3762 / F11) TaxID=1314773 RepID=A0A3N2Q8H1_SODAK|nr:hypothetical protein SODALDRAFT_29367 [Sodiomyces alkalinus F11]ROT43052.1 hypothetical protein SODALDRAFT_29367 [Sodiomyces alkalinus F11]
MGLVVSHYTAFKTSHIFPCFSSFSLLRNYFRTSWPLKPLFRNVLPSPCLRSATPCPRSPPTSKRSVHLSVRVSVHAASSVCLRVIIRLIYVLSQKRTGSVSVPTAPSKPPYHCTHLSASMRSESRHTTESLATRQGVTWRTKVASESAKDR